VLDFAEAAASSLEAALDAPAASVAVMSEELYGARLQAITAGTETPAPEIERSMRGNILRGRIEEIAGWTLYNQDKASEAIERLRRATSLLPENSGWRRTALWHLGAALEASGNEQEALDSYLQSYDKNAPDEGRRAIIERLYRKLNGSLAGLEAKLGTASTASNTPGGNLQAGTGEARQTDAATESAKNADAAKTNEGAAQSQKPPAQEEDAAAVSQPPASGGETTSSSAQPETQAAQPSASPAQSPADKGATGTQTGAANQSQAAATPERTTAAPASRPRRKQNESADCSFSINVDTITIKNNGGSGVITAQLSGADKITPTTRDWPDITVFAQTLKEYGTFPFLITSISKRTGRYLVSFTTPCGSKDVTVIVK
jgi:tetratricopeptide (TPR) repeat protein